MLLSLPNVRLVNVLGAVIRPVTSYNLYRVTIIIVYRVFAKVNIYDRLCPLSYKCACVVACPHGRLDLSRRGPGGSPSKSPVGRLQIPGAPR